jgi:hypothetical protein
MQMDPRHLYQLATNVIPAGIHLHAQADLPGQFDAYCRTDPNWAGLMQTLFGIVVTSATPGLDLIATNDCYAPINLRGTSNLGPITPKLPGGSADPGDVAEDRAGLRPVCPVRSILPTWTPSWSKLGC